MQSQITPTGLQCELTEEDCQAMLQKARDTVAYTYPMGGHGYAAVVLTDKGNMYEGVSYQTEVEVLTIHGEAAALVHAATHGETRIVAITGPNCHCCKQMIYESGLQSNIDVIVVIEEEGVVKQIPISTLMPYPWPKKLKK